MNTKIFCALFIALSGLTAQAGSDENLNLPEQLEVVAPTPRFDNDNGSSGASVWQCVVTDGRGRRFVARHRSERRACALASQKCRNNSARPKTCG